MEEKHNTDRWNVYSLKEYFDRAITSLENRIDQRFVLADKALEKAESANTRRLESMNEIREQLREQATTFIQRNEYLSSEKFVNQKVESLAKLVYIGLGIWIVLQLILVFILTIIFKA